MVMSNDPRPRESPKCLVAGVLSLRVDAVVPKSLEDSLG